MSNAAQSQVIHARDYGSPHKPQSSRVPRQLVGAIFATAVLSFLGLLLETVVNVLFPALMAEFAIDMGAVSWMTSGYLLVVSIVMPLSGYLQRRFTGRSLFIGAVLFVVVGALVAASAPTYAVLLAGRMFQGVGTGVATPLMFTTILTQAPRSKIGQLMGLGTLVLGVAPALGPTIGGAIVSVTSWRAIFWAVIPIALVALLVGGRSLRQVTPVSRVPLKFGQLTALTLAMVGLLLGIERTGALLSGRSEGLVADLTAATLLVIGAVSLATFVALSRRSTSPLLRLGVFTDHRFTWSLLAFASLQFATVGLGYLLPNLTQLGLGKSALVAGLVGLPGAIVAAVFAPLGGMLLDRFGPRGPIMTGAIIAVTGAVILAVVGTRFGVVGLAVMQFVYMFGFGLAFANTQTFGMSRIASDLTADGTAAMNTAQQFSGSLGMTVLATFVAASQMRALPNGRVEDQALFASSAYQSATVSGAAVGFIVVTAVVLFAFFSTWRAQRA